MPNSVSCKAVTVAGPVAACCRRKNGSKLVSSAIGEPGTVTPAGRQSPSGPTGVASAHSSRAVWTASPAISASSATE